MEKWLPAEENTPRQRPPPTNLKKKNTRCFNRYKDQMGCDERETHRERQTDRQTETDRQTDRQTDRERELG